MTALGMPVFQPMVEAVKKGSWLASWNSETHSLLGRSHRVEIKMGDGSRSQGKSMFHFKGHTTGLDFFLSFFINGKKEKDKIHQDDQVSPVKVNQKKGLLGI
ncbi:hypothetical protein DN752_15270 [Echinicola strongylocentroti]|uniref:Uncharacterized protein n=2 Tax=Echinicola strongylocentroti TaxID=1795355 RepID=A0A2Z4IKX6_9BACT|nr:hypothetical protein DN752_15270 [Echinicola strongylocentroti]